MTLLHHDQRHHMQALAGACLLPGGCPHSCVPPHRRRLRADRPQRRRQLLAVRAHGNGHSHSHGHSNGNGHSHSHSHSHGHSHGIRSCCSASTSHKSDDDSLSWAQALTGSMDGDHAPNVPVNRLQALVTRMLGAVGALWLSEQLHDNIAVSVAITAMFVLAAASAWLLSRQPAAAAGLRAACVGGIFLLAGLPEVVSLLQNVAVGHVDTHVLMTLACFGTLAIGSALEGALLLVLFQVSHALEHALTHRAQGNLRSLFDRVPAQALLVELDAQGEPRIAAARAVPSASVEVGATMLVRPGEQVALDGEVVYGEALVSTEHITGEALPVRRTSGDEVPAGALNHDGLLVVRASRPAGESTPARIARLTQHAQARKPQLGRWLDRFGQAYARAVMAATAASFAGLLAAGVPLLSDGARRGALYRALGLLTTASPCALVLVPLAYVCAIAAVTHRGILIKGGRVLDALVQCSTVALDKTGTLTTGKLSCTGMLTPGAAAPPSNGAAAPSGQHWAHALAASGRQEDVLALASVVALSERASHPVSRAAAALAQHAGGRLPPAHVDAFKLVPGAGVQGRMQRDGAARDVRFGSLEFAAVGLAPQQAAAAGAAAAAASTDSVVSLFVDAPAPGGAGGDAVVRVLTFADTVHARSAAAIKDLQSGTWGASGRALEVAMLTGDNAASAGRVGRQLGIRRVRAGLSPQEKLDAVEAARQRGGGVIMVGDGINDAPALAAANVGVAVTAAPTEAAAAAADVLLLAGDGIAALPFLLRIAHRTRAVLKQNLALAGGAMLALSLPVLCGALPLWVAVALHEGSTLLVALNCLRLLHRGDPIDAERRSGAREAAAAEPPALAAAAAAA